jgi:radical SAM protein with 4Fe4S-binding SPASM domain
VPCGFDPMISARNDGDTGPVLLRIGRADLKRVLGDAALNPEPLPATSPDVRTDLDETLCGAGHNACYVSAYGDVTPCVALPIVCGNIRQTPFAQIWRDSRDMQKVRAVRVRDLHTCSGCTASAYCSRCPGQALLEDGDLYGPSSAACEHALAGAELAGSAAVPASMSRARTSA